MSPELRVMTAPPSAYRRLASGHTMGLAGALKRPLVVAVVVGTAISIYTARRATLGLAVSGVLTWSFAAVVQMLAAAALVASSRQRTVSLPAGVDLLFMGHAPWSLWLIAVAAWSVWLPRPADMDFIVAVTAVVPLSWTVVIVFAFCRCVLHDDRYQAARRTLFHQSLIWTFAGAYIAIAVQLWPRLLGLTAP